MKHPTWRFIIVAAILGVLAVIWWFGPRFGKVRIEDLATPQRFTVGGRSSARSGITIHVEGRIDGTAYVFVNAYQKEEFSGNVDREFYSDWFENEFTIVFEPGTAIRGELEVSYVIH